MTAPRFCPAEVQGWIDRALRHYTQGRHCLRVAPDILAWAIKIVVPEAQALRLTARLQPTPQTPLVNAAIAAGLRLPPVSTLAARLGTQ